MRIDQIISNRKGTAHAWHVEHAESDPFVGNEYELWHYGTRMLKWRESHRYGVEVIDMSTGYGSVSDQNGMNIAFRVLSLPYYFSRAGGAAIGELCPCSEHPYHHRHSDGHVVRSMP